MPNTPTISWETYEHQHREHAGDWFWALGIVAGSVALTSVILGNYFFALVVVTFAVTLGISATRPARRAVCKIDKRGFHLDSTTHSHASIIAFWIDETDEEHGPLLLIDTTRPLSPNIIVPLGNIDPDEVRAAFIAYNIPEVEMHESLIMQIAERFGF